ncbi:MAG: ROK family protein [Mycobacteriaceae bacterium]|nr:ROK family protein [Mycobacteriaceae bacterium]
MATLALDIGGTKIAAGRIDLNTGGVQDIHAIMVPDRGVWDVTKALLREVAAGEKVERVGIASAGPVDMAAGITAPINVPEWRSGFGIVAAVKDQFPDAQIRFALDGVCIALAEQRYGAARNVPDALVMTVSTGVGGGILVGGFTAVGRSGNAGHVGHIQVSGFDDPCSCGGRGCVEAIASGPSSVRWARSQGWHGETGKDLADAAQAGDPVAVAALHRAGTALGQAIASAAALLDVDLVVVGGGFAQSGPPLWDPLREAVQRQAGLGFLANLRVVASPLRDSATLVGAGVLVS